jgi:dTDP-4-dehydrorhamnose reductase
VDPILLLGAGGQLGSDLVKTLPSASLIPLKRVDVDVTDLSAVDRALDAHRPAWVVNTTAFHRVDDIERDPESTRQAFLVNAAAVHHLAHACRRHRARLLHLSTDYVFGGGPPGPYAEDGRTAPLNAYGVSKLAGEQLIGLTDPAHVIVRSSGLYGVAGSAGKGGNFVETMLRLAHKGGPIKVVNDQTLAPTYTADLAAGIARLMAANAPGGVYHLTSGGACSWFEFAGRIFQLCGLTPELAPTTSDEFGAPARRPRYSVLANTRAAALGLPPLPQWPEALAAYLRAREFIPR